jgi:DNA polymerase (family X)
MHNFSNKQLVELLNSVAASLAIKNRSIFEIRAYQNAADSVEHSTVNVQDLWEEGRLDELPGLGKSLQAYLDELFRTGEVGHFITLKKGIPEVVFELLKISGIGPKTAQKLAELGVKDSEDLAQKIKVGSLVEKGFSAKIAEKILLGLEEDKGDVHRMLLPFASSQAIKILDYLRKGPGVIHADPLGSLRRMVVTVGDLDFAAAGKNQAAIIDYFVSMPGVARIINQGENKATVLLKSGIQVDLLVGSPDSYGALLQHFTGGKNHNIKLRTYAQKHNLSLNEDGVRVKAMPAGRQGKGEREKLIETKTEEEFYKLLGMDVPPPEIREDAGEIEAALNHKLPNLVKLGDIKGDLHLHSNFPIEHPSHGPGVNPIEEIIKMAAKLGYEYIGISDHPPAHRKESREKIIDWVKKRTDKIEQLKSSFKGTIKVLNGLEIDITLDGTLSVPNEALATLDYCIAGIHSGHRSSTHEHITKRLMSALSSEYVDIISHPTGRILNERGSYEADWEKVFEYAAKNKKLLEINAFPNRLDLRDDLVRKALEFGCKFIIDTDAHEVSQMENMLFGVSVAKRGWVEAKDIVNTWDWKKFSEWFGIK